MKVFKLLTALAVVVFAFAGSAMAQKKSSKPKKSTPVKLVAPLDVRAGGEKVDIQLANVNSFVDKLGLIAQGLEVADADAKAGNLSAKTAAKITAKKAEIIEAIRNIRDALNGLESEFRTKPALQKYLPNIQGVTDMAARSEDMAIAGKFVAAKDPLREASKKLTDTLAVMPL